MKTQDSPENWREVGSQVTALAETLNDTAIRTSALENIRSLISSVTIHEVDGRTTIELEGSSVKVVAGA
ncbi:MAG: hypothetical protein KKH33_09060 [Alphaproteobacteria bacterium]|nr:hypothetical protein [Alphaproteobacteria bacterium]